MGVYIKDMKMPKSCRKCCLCDFDRNGYYCIKLEKILDKWHVRTQRDYDCPLIEVQTPHGRLIDVDELYGAIVDKGQMNERGKYRIGDSWELTGREVRDVIDGQPTIIGAEESGL